MIRGYLGRLKHDLEAPIEARGLGTGWFAGFFAILLAIAGLCFVAALRWPEYFSMPELASCGSGRASARVVHLTLLAAYALALLSLLLRPRKAIGATALVIGIAASLLGGAERPAGRSAELGHLLRARFLHGQPARHRPDVRADRAVLPAPRRSSACSASNGARTCSII